jgi:hypothetical protein
MYATTQNLLPVEQIKSLLKASGAGTRDLLAEDRRVLTALAELSKYGKLEPSPERTDALNALQLIPRLFESDSNYSPLSANSNIASSVALCLRSFGEEGIDCCIDFLKYQNPCNSVRQSFSELRSELYRLLLDNYWTALPKLEKILKAYQFEQVDNVPLGALAHIRAADTDLHGFIRFVIDYGIQALDADAIRAGLSALIRIGEVSGTGDLLRKVFCLTESALMPNFSSINPLQAVVVAGSESGKCIAELRAFISDRSPAWDVIHELDQVKESLADLVEGSGQSSSDNQPSIDWQEHQTANQGSNFERDYSSKGIRDQVLAILTLGQLGNQASEALPEINLLLAKESCPEVLKITARWAHSAISGDPEAGLEDLLKLNASEDRTTRMVLSDLSTIRQQSECPGLLEDLFAHKFCSLEIGSDGQYFKARELAEKLLDSDKPRDLYRLIPANFQTEPQIIPGFTKELASRLYLDVLAFGTDRASRHAADYLSMHGHLNSIIRGVYNLFQERIQGTVIVDGARFARICSVLDRVAPNALVLAPLVAQIVPTLESHSHQTMACLFLSHMGARALPEIKALCSHEDTYVRHLAYCNLARSSSSTNDLIDTLRKGLNDQSKLVQLGAIKAISGLPNCPSRISAFIHENERNYGGFARIIGLYKEVVAERRFKLSHLTFLVPTLKSMRSLAIKWLDDPHYIP